MITATTFCIVLLLLAAFIVGLIALNMKARDTIADLRKRLELVQRVAEHYAGLKPF